MDTVTTEEKKGTIVKQLKNVFYILLFYIIQEAFHKYHDPRLLFKYT